MIMAVCCTVMWFLKYCILDKTPKANVIGMTYISCMYCTHV